MKKLLNTVYVTSEGASLRKDGENLVAEVDGSERARVPFHMMSSVVVFGGIFVSPPLMQALAFLGIEQFRSRNQFRRPCGGGLAVQYLHHERMFAAELFREKAQRVRQLRTLQPMCGRCNAPSKYFTFSSSNNLDRSK